MKLLILGSRGNLGQQLVRLFALDELHEYDIICWDKEEIDITDFELLTSKITELNPNLIINAIAYNNVDLCEKDEFEYVLAQKLNTELPEVLAGLCLDLGASLIHYSTDYVFEGTQLAGYQEDDVPNPINRYGETKLAGEREILKLSGKGLSWKIIRTSKLFGPKGSSIFVKPSFFKVMQKLAMDRDEVDAVDEELSCFTYTIDLAQATKDLVESNTGCGIYHITNSNATTWYQAVKMLYEILQLKIKVNPVTSEKFPRPARRPKTSVLLNTKTINLRPWNEALREYLESFPED